MDHRDAGVAFAFNEVLVVTETLLPRGVCGGIRCPAQLPESAFTVGVQVPFYVLAALGVDPGTERVAVLLVLLQDSCVAFALHEALVVGVTFLPRCGPPLRCPA